MEIILCNKCCGKGYQKCINIIKLLKDKKIDVSLNKGHPSKFKDKLISLKADYNAILKDKKPRIIIKDKIYTELELTDVVIQDIIKSA